MADLPEDDGWVEGVRAIEETDPVRFDVYNESLSALASRTKYLQENMGGGGSVPVEWIEGTDEEVPLTDLSPDTMYILDVRSGNRADIVIPENHSSIPVGAEYHFVCAGDTENAHIYEYNPALEPE